MKKFNLSLAILFMFTTLIPAFVAQANMTLLHDWSEPEPKSPYGFSGSPVIWPFTSSTTKNAYIYNAPPRLIITFPAVQARL